MFFRKRRIWNAELEKIPAAYASRAVKYYDAWKSSLQEGRSPMGDAQPWLSFEAIDYLSAFLKKDMRVFEFGGGGSTLFFASRVAEVVTAEHDEEWFPAIGKAVAEKKLGNWKGIAVPPQPGGNTSASPADPDAYISDDAAYKGKNFRNYAAAIDAFPDQYFDVVIVDGRVRPSCIKHGIPKVKQGGLLVLDNSDRTYYLEQTASLINASFDEVLSYPGPGPYLEWFTQTTIWKKRG